MGNENSLSHVIELPCHDTELLNADDQLETLKSILNKHKKNKSITDKEFVWLFEEIIRVLDYVGKLSLPAFEIEDELEEHYKIKYIHSPALARQLWLEHYSNVHHPYNIEKNRCYKVLDELDEFYIGLYDKEPPNWKI